MHAPNFSRSVVLSLSHGEVLELGPFSGGISVELARLHPGLSITIAAQDPGVVGYLRKEIERAGRNRKMEVAWSGLDNLVFADCLFDVVMFRGAYFFLDEEGKILWEIKLRSDPAILPDTSWSRRTKT